MPPSSTPHHLAAPLPLRNWVREDGGWVGRLWRKPDVHRAILGGGWFAPNLAYCFDSRATAEYAFAASATLTLLMEV